MGNPDPLQQMIRHQDRLSAVSVRLQIWTEKVVVQAIWILEASDGAVLHRARLLQ